MGSGYGEGENRAEEAAQEAICSPLLDNVSIAGAKGVLINITGGTDLGIDEVTQISSIIHESAGDEAEIIFGAVEDPTMDGKVRVTVIATGFDSEAEKDIVRPDFRRPATPARKPQPQVEAQPQVQRQVAVGGGAPITIGGSAPAPTPSPAPVRAVSPAEMGELDIPTFIRRGLS